MRETYLNPKFDKGSIKIPEGGSIGSFRLKKILRLKDEAIHDKKAEICKLRETNDDLRLAINMMVRGINNMQVIGLNNRCFK